MTIDSSKILNVFNEKKMYQQFMMKKDGKTKDDYDIYKIFNFLPYKI
jgi:hypothetical protein